MILAIRTDKPQAELYLFEKDKQIDQLFWEAHRQLADTLLEKIEYILSVNKTKLADLKGVIVFTGEGSFTGLRIGTTVANTLGYSLNIPVTASESINWIKEGQVNLKNSKPGEYVIPKYHSDPNITKSKKLALEERPK